MQAAGLSFEEIREVARARAADGTGISLFFDLDPSRFATAAARKEQITSLLDKGRREAESERFGHAQQAALRERLAQAREMLARENLLEGSQALAVFLGFDADGSRVVRLPVPAGPELAIDSVPLVPPLIEGSSGGRWCVVLASREEGRIFLGDRHALSELMEVHDDVHGRHDQGGESQARYQRSVEEEARRHLARLARTLLRVYEGPGFDQIAVGGTEENARALLDRLHSSLADRYAGRFAIEVAGAAPERVLELARPLIDARRESELGTIREELQQQLATGGRAVQGLEPTLEALTEQRVRELLVARDLEAAGTRCPRCERLGPDGESRCPYDGSELSRRERIVDDAVRKAVEGSARVWLLESSAEAPGGTAALTHS